MTTTEEMFYQWRQRELMKIPENRQAAIDQLQRKIDAIKEGLPMQKSKSTRSGIDFSGYLNLKR